MRASLIITAAGSSSRFRESLTPAASLKSQKVSKIFFELGGIPVLERTLKAFSAIPQIKETIVTVQPGHELEAARWASRRGLKNIKFVAGGKTRAESVYLGLKKTSSLNSLTIVHDGARPFIKREAVQKLLAQAAKYDGILLARQVIPTLKKISPDKRQIEGTVDRSQLAEAETPQIVKRSFLLNAYKNVPNAFAFTDESSLVEAAGGKKIGRAHV